MSSEKLGGSTMPEVEVSKFPEAVVGNRLLSAPEVQEILGVGKSTLYALLKSKKDPIPSIKIGKNRRFKLDKLLWWIEKHEQ